MKAFTRLFLGLLIINLFTPTHIFADGMFVVPQFVWDKHKDINEPTQKAILLYDAGREDMILQVKYEGPVSEFGWLVPVPNLPTVKSGSMQSFYELSQYTQKQFNEELPALMSRGFGSHGAISAGLDNAAASEPPPVKVVQTKTVGAYKIAVLSTRDADALKKWLTTNQFYFPADKADVLNDYVQRHWYFIAIKINLRSALMPFRSTSEKLASGELNPLQISFASDECVFPLRISSANGKPSEVQLYVLSRKPLVEQSMFEKEFDEIRRDDMEENARQIEMQRTSRLIMSGIRLHNQNRLSLYDPEMPAVQTNVSMDEILRVVPEDKLLKYASVDASDLPRCARDLPQLNHDAWWLSKQTWTFQPKEMHDLTFEPAMDVLARDLAGEEGYFAAANLARIGDYSAATVAAALRSPNPAVRIHAASLLEQEWGDDNWPVHNPQILSCLPALFQDTEPQVRKDAAVAAGASPYPKFEPALVHLLRDDNEDVREAAGKALDWGFAGKFERDPEVQKLMTDPNLGIRATAFEANYNATIPAQDLLPLLSYTNASVVHKVLLWLASNGFTYDEIAPVFQNPSREVRLDALRFLERVEDNDPDAIDLIMAQLHNSDPLVCSAAGRTLQNLTGQDIPEDQPAQWEQWWAQNRTSYLLATRNRYIVNYPGGRGYHDRGCAYYDLGRYAVALADFRKACKLGSDVTDYSECRVWLIQTRLGAKEEATQGLTAYLAQRKGNPDDWSAKIGRYLLGQVSEADLLTASATPGVETAPQQLCEAYFYIGSKHLLDGDKTTAMDNFKKCLATHVTNFQEYASAEAEFNRLSTAKAMTLN